MCGRQLRGGANEEMERRYLMMFAYAEQSIVTDFYYCT